MADSARKSDPAVWARVKAAVTAVDKGGTPGPKQSDNRLTAWTRKRWGMRPGASRLESGERALPRAGSTRRSPPMPPARPRRQYSRPPGRKQEWARAIPTMPKTSGRPSAVS
jgi:hypothetical protein